MAARYVALGDSISIDDYAGGPGRGGASLLHRNHDEDFPQWRAHDLATGDPDATFHLLATDGATTSTLLTVQLPRLLALDLRPTVVSVTIGGNDVLSAYGDTAAARVTIRRVSQALSLSLRELLPLLAPDGQVIVGTVYDPSDGSGDAARLGLPPWPDAVRVIGELNSALRDVAAEHGATVAEIGEYFSGHGLLGGDPTRPDPRPANRELWLCSVIEPNAWGAGGVRAAFWDALQASSG